MAQILVRNLNDETLAQLKRRAERAGRSLEAEVREILEDEGGRDTRREAGLRRLAEIQDSFGNRVFPESGPLRRQTE